MYSIFAPLIMVQCSIGVIAFGFMLYYNRLLALVALAMMPLLYRVGMRMRESMFPISWVIQARLAGVATVVDENVNGVRVVKSFAQEQAELDKLADAAKKVEWAYIKDADIRATFTPWVQNLPQIGLALGPLHRRVARHQRRPQLSARFSRSTSTSGCCRRRS